MLQEARKFLDLDMVAQGVLDDGDRSLLLEAIQCYQIGSHRASVILTWCATADCLKRHIDELAAEGDAQAQQSQTDLKVVEGQSSYEENLIVCARKCELIDDFDERCLRFARDTRSQCAHPTGVIPSAEAVRHIIHICTQSVLSRRGYRGMSFVSDVVTTQFDDKFFLPEEKKLHDHCRAIIRKVPPRLHSQFPRLAAQKRPGVQSEIWQRNAMAFFRTLVSDAEDYIVKQIASAFQGFEAGAPDFFAELVGLENRVAAFWDDQKRSQARARLINASAVKITPENVHSWAVICCSGEGLEPADEDMLRQRFGGISKHLAMERQMLTKQRGQLLKVLGGMLIDDATSDQAVIAMRNLCSSELFDSQSDDVQVIVETIIERFAHDPRYRRVLDQASEWTTGLLASFSEQTELFLKECFDDDNADDVMILFEVIQELSRRSPDEVPSAFSDVVNRVLRKDLFAEWSENMSTIGRVFHRQLALLLEQHTGTFPTIERALIIVFDEDDGFEASAEPSGEIL